MISIPSEANTTSKLVVNLASRSRTKNRKPENRSARSRARWVTHGPVGWGVMPPRWTRRVACSMKMSTYKR